MTATPLSNRAHRFVISGDLASPSFLPWVARYSDRLGVRCQQLAAGPDRAEFLVQGQPDLVDALEMGCLLGPFDVWVESVQRHPD